jgi:hypothetical protein
VTTFRIFFPIWPSDNFCDNLWIPGTTLMAMVKTCWHPWQQLVKTCWQPMMTTLTTIVITIFCDHAKMYVVVVLINR